MIANIAEFSPPAVLARHELQRALDSARAHYDVAPLFAGHDTVICTSIDQAQQFLNDMFSDIYYRVRVQGGSPKQARCAFRRILSEIAGESNWLPLFELTTRAVATLAQRSSDNMFPAWIARIKESGLYYADRVHGQMFDFVSRVVAENYTRAMVADSVELIERFQTFIANPNDSRVIHKICEPKSLIFGYVRRWLDASFVLSYDEYELVGGTTEMWVSKGKSGLSNPPKPVHISGNSIARWHGALVVTDSLRNGRINQVGQIDVVHLFGHRDWNPAPEYIYFVVRHSATEVVVIGWKVEDLTNRYWYYRGRPLDTLSAAEFALCHQVDHLRRLGFYMTSSRVVDIKEL